MMFQRSYMHMLERMKKDLVSTSIKANDLTDSLKQKSGYNLFYPLLIYSIMQEESDKSMKSKELRMQTKNKLETLMKNIDVE